jgi:hypothetical protein
VLDHDESFSVQDPIHNTQIPDAETKVLRSGHGENAMGSSVEAEREDRAPKPCRIVRSKPRDLSFGRAGELSPVRRVAHSFEP